jgi:hypothetical protein
MTQTSGETGMTDERFWYNEAQKLLAPLFVAARHAGKSMRAVLEWLQREDVTSVLTILEHKDQQALTSITPQPVLRSPGSSPITRI